MTKVRVRTTSSSRAPTCASAASRFVRVWRAWTYGSPGPAIAPSGSVAVQPETQTSDPARTTREYPTSASYRTPDPWRSIVNA